MLLFRLGKYLNLDEMLVSSEEGELFEQTLPGDLGVVAAGH